MSIKYHDVNVGVTLGSGGGGGGGPVETWDFTGATPLVGTIRGFVIAASGVTFGSSGAVFDSTSDYIKLPDLTPLTIELDVASMSLTSGTNRRFVMGTTSNGLIYRSTGVWGLYYGSWEMSSETDGSFFDNSTVKVVVDADNKWHIYKNGVLWWEPTNAQALTAPSIGSSGTSINNAVIRSLTLS